MINKKISIEIGVLAGILIVFVILFSSYVCGFAVSSTGKPVEISPGETRDIHLITLQNMAGESDITLKASILEGSEIVELIDPSDIYPVPLGTKTKVNVRISMPSNAEIGESYNLKLAFTTVTTDAPGTFGLGSSIEKNIKIIVVSGIAEIPEEKPEIETSTWILIAAIVIIIAIIAIYTILRKRKQTK